MENKFPSQIKYIIGNEACERFSFYGMRAILVVFMMNQLQKSAADAKATYHLFNQAVYFLPLLGAWISDKYWGKYKTIFYLSLVYCLGHATLAVWENETGLLVGLGLIAFGGGGIKPCVSAFCGDQFTAKNQHLIEKVYSLFYFSINFGAFFSSLLTPWLLVKYGASIAFGVPGILMALATLIFWLGRKEYTVNLPEPQKDEAGFFTIFLYALKARFTNRALANASVSAAVQQSAMNKGAATSFLDLAYGKFSTEAVDGTKAAWNVIKLFSTVAVFWALFDQQGSSWTIQAQQMDRHFLGFELEASQIQALNPIFVLALIPVFSYGIYPALQKMGFNVTPLRKMSAGMLLAGFAFLVSALIQVSLDQGMQLSVGWQLIPYFLITGSEVMVSITGLEFAYTQAPPSMKSTLTSFWLLTVTFGNLLDAVIAKINVFTGAQEFFFFSALMMLVGIVFAAMASRFKSHVFLRAQ